MAQKKNQLIVAELDLMASELEAKGNPELAGLIDEVSAELLLDTPTVAAKAPKDKMAPKPAKSNGKRRKKNKKKTAAPKLVVSRADAKKILKAAHSELLEIAGELIKDGDLKEARHIIRYAEEVQAEEEKLDMPMSPEMPAGLAPAEDEEPSEDDEEDLDGDGDDDADDMLPGMEDDEDADDEDDEMDEDADDEDDEMDEDVEAMIRKYELGDDSPAAPAAPTPAPSAPKADKPKSDKPEAKDDDKDAKGDKPKAPKSDKPEDKDDDKDEEKEDDKEEDDKEPKADKEEKPKDDKDEEKGEKEAKVKLFDLAKKLAAAGEVKLAYSIADLLDRQK